MPLQVHHNIIILKWLFIISILLSLIQSVSSYPNPVSNVDPRFGHTATLINDTIYFVGGRTNDNVFTIDFISLNISLEFQINLPPWMELDSTGMPRTIFHSAVSGGLNNSKIVVFGGTVDDPASAAMTSLTIYDPSYPLWTPQIISSTPTRRHSHSAVILSNKIMLIYGGEVTPTTGNSFDVDELWGFNSISLSGWQGFPSLANYPGIRERHTASVIGNKMIILGGSDGKSSVPMSNVYVFDSDTVDWSLVTAIGQVPSPREAHSAVVFGDVAVLDTTNWNWVAPPTNNTPTARFLHTATIIGANMIIAFGRTTPGQGTETIDNHIYCLNLLTWTWVDRYVPLSFPSGQPLIKLPSSTTRTSATSNQTPTSSNSSIRISYRIISFININFLFRLNDDNYGDGSNQPDIEQSTQPQNSIFVNRLLGNTSDNNIKPSDPEDRRRSVKFSETNTTIPVYTKGHHPQGSVEVELGDTNDVNGIDILGLTVEDNKIHVQLQPHDGASVVIRELRVVNPDIINPDNTDQEDN
ncbi:7942_t:CDS:2 [Cetraspora pellucida]|uniref:7942_t:CDS:1 n=1 Tax=Cetraspora pellucida TaxID=1433469 RepID=A0A9N9D9E8_9GLOM|nr:7942_t:CDS:2 [Cetraspora pellucida]